MSKKKHNIPSLQQFLDYIHSRMDSRQQHSFEQQMQKDSFAEEAMEGLSKLDEDRIQRDIGMLNQKIRGKGRTKRTFWVGSVAASLALLVVVGIAFWAIERTRKLQEQNILTHEEPAVLPDLTMNADMATLSEVVVVGYGTRSVFPQDYVEPDYKKSSSYLPPEPVGGQRAFRSYINEQAIIPPSSDLSRAIVVVEFDVDTQGRLSDFRFLRSPGLPFEEKAKEILQGGPEWRAATLSGAPPRETVRVRMVFRKQTE